MPYTIAWTAGRCQSTNKTTCAPSSQAERQRAIKEGRKPEQPPEVAPAPVPSGDDGDDEDDEPDDDFDLFTSLVKETDPIALEWREVGASSSRARAREQLAREVGARGSVDERARTCVADGSRRQWKTPWRRR